MPNAYNNVGVLTATSGTGTMTLGNAINSTYLTEVEAGVPNAAVVSYVIFQGTDIEGGRGTYTSAGRTLSRDTVHFSKIGGTAGTTKITLDGSAEVRLIQLAADIIPIERTITAGAGLTGTGDLSANRTLDVGAGTGITVAADSVGLDTTSNRNIDHSTIVLTAGAGLTGGGDTTASRSFAVGAGTGITVNADDVALTSPVTATLGGTGQTSYAVGDILFASTTTALSKLADVATGNALISGGVNTAPSWGKIALTTHVSGTLPVANGGTGQTTEAEALGEMTQALTEDTAPDWAADFLASYDASADTGKKIKLTTMSREVLQANRTYYVRTDGSDANTGLVDNSGGAFATWNKAINTISDTLDLRGFTVTIAGNNATHTDTALFQRPWVGGGGVTLDCAGGTISTTSADCIDIAGSCDNSLITVQNVTLTTTTSGAGMLINGNNANVLFGAGVVFGAIVDSGVQFANCVAGKVRFVNNYTISGSCSRHLRMFNSPGSMFYSDGVTVTLSGTPAWGNAFAQIGYGGFYRCNSMTFSGSATGKRYDVFNNGIIDTGTASATYLPGNVSGTSSTQGQYQ